MSSLDSLGNRRRVFETYNFVKDHQFSELHVFPYSKRTGTPAARKEDQVDEHVKNERVHRLIALSDPACEGICVSIRRRRTRDYSEESFKEKDGEHNLYVGYTDNYMKVVFEGSEDMIGRLVKVKITKAGYPYNEGQFVRMSEDIQTRSK